MSGNFDKQERGMEAVLKFPLPECQDEFETAASSLKFKGAIQDFDNQLRGWLKHGGVDDSMMPGIQHARDELHRQLSDAGLSLFE